MSYAIDECPWCEAELDHFDDEVAADGEEMDCPHCEKPIEVVPEYSVSYMISKVEPKSVKEVLAGVAKDMAKIIDDPAATDDDKALARNTICTCSVPDIHPDCPWHGGWIK